MTEEESMNGLQYRSHRGGVYDTPENTMPAFLHAIRMGYASIETDPQMTRDGVAVLMHDATINRTCRWEDGSAITEPMRVCDLTYRELLQFDAGIAKGEQFRGTRIPRLEELLQAAEGSGAVIALDKKIATDDVKCLTDVVRRFDTPVSFSTSDTARIRAVQAQIPHAAFDYDVNLEAEALAEVRGLVDYDKLTVWLYLDRPNFAWLRAEAKATKDRVERIRRTARFGIANISTPTDVMEAVSYDPYMIEL